MAKIIVSIDENRFAVGTEGRLADYVVMKTKEGYAGVRGRRPKLTKGRFSTVKGNKKLRAALGIEG